MSAQEFLARFLSNASFPSAPASPDFEKLKKSFYWRCKAAENGDVYSRNFLYGLGSSKDEMFEKYQEEMLKILFDLAEKENFSVAQVALGNILGLGTSKMKSDPKKALELFSAATKNNEYARYRLGLCYWDGIGTADTVENKRIALRHILIAAERGDKTAKYFLETILYDDPFFKGNSKEIYAWMKDFADKENFAWAQCIYGKVLLRGNGSLAPKNEVLGLEYLKKAATRSVAEAQNIIGFYEHKRTPANYAEAEMWYLKAAGQDHANAQAGLANLYWHEHIAATSGMPNLKRALYWSCESIKNGDTTFENFLYEGRCLNLESVQKNKEAFFNWVKELADEGKTPAQVLLALIHTRGFVGEKNLELGMQWLDKAAENGDKVALAERGRILTHGLEGVKIKPDEAAALKNYLAAAERNDVVALMDLGDIFWNGTHGVKRDLARSKKYYERAADVAKDEKTRTAAWHYLGHLNWGENKKLSIRYFFFAANAGHKEAKDVAYGRLFREEWIQSNQKEVFTIVEELAEKEKLAAAQFILAGLYEVGFGVEKDSVKALHWYREAIKKTE